MARELRGPQGLSQPFAHQTIHVFWGSRTLNLGTQNQALAGGRKRGFRASAYTLTGYDTRREISPDFQRGSA